MELAARRHRHIAPGALIGYHLAEPDLGVTDVGVIIAVSPGVWRIFWAVDGVSDVLWNETDLDEILRDELDSTWSLISE